MSVGLSLSLSRPHNPLPKLNRKEIASCHSAEGRQFHYWLMGSAKAMLNFIQYIKTAFVKWTSIFSLDYLFITIVRRGNVHHLQNNRLEYIPYHAFLLGGDIQHLKMTDDRRGNVHPHPLIPLQNMGGKMSTFNSSSGEMSMGVSSY